MRVEVRSHRVNDGSFSPELMFLQELLTLLMPRKIAHELLAGSSFSQTLNKVAIVFIYVESYRERACGSGQSFPLCLVASYIMQHFLFTGQMIPTKRLNQLRFSISFTRTLIALF